MPTIITGFSAGLSSIYNRIITESDGKLFYTQLDESEFAGIFGGENRLTLYAAEGEKPVAFLSAACPNEKGVAYLSYVGVLPEYRGNGIATSLLEAAEKELRAMGAKRIDTVFYDPAHLPWIIPGSTDGHPCAPGTPSGSDAEKLLLSRGYTEWTAQISYYGRLSDYKAPEGLEEKRRKLLNAGIEITLYDPSKHHGLPELFDAIKNPGWKAGVLAHLDRPVVVAVDNNNSGLVVGYTGPLSLQKEGTGLRGVFNGIGTHPDYRGKGIATQIFCEMCRRHKEAGGDFMSLYTGETNPARHVYEAAGLKAVARWSNLRLVFNEQ